MPEMPEVETVRRTLTPLVKGKTIAKIIIWYPKIIVNNPDEFVEKLTNKKILKIDRYGKYLLFRFSGYINYFLCGEWKERPKEIGK